jgi:hypothetical protein
MTAMSSRAFVASQSGPLSGCAAVERRSRRIAIAGEQPRDQRTDRGGADGDDVAVPSS